MNNFIEEDSNNSLLIEAKNIVKKYQKKVVVNNDLVKIYNYDRIGLIGQNGCGKTTLVEMLASIRRPTSGKINIKPNLKIGMQIQESYFAKGVTVMDLIKLYVDNFAIDISAEKLDSLLHNLDVWPLVRRTLHNLSGGQKQKINILLAILINPDLIILDELSTGLDVNAKEVVFNTLEEFLLKNNKALILISHNMEELERFTKSIWLMKNGKIIEKLETQKIIKEYKSLEKFVRSQFTEYNELDKIKNKYKKEDLNNEWAKRWNKSNEKRKEKNKK